MDFKQATQRAEELGFDINATNGTRTWFCALKRWDYTGQTFSLEVRPDENQFRFVMMHGLILIDSTWLGSFDNDVHFMSWQRRFMEVIEKLV